MVIYNKTGDEQKLLSHRFYPWEAKEMELEEGVELPEWAEEVKEEEPEKKVRKPRAKKKE